MIRSLIVRLVLFSEHAVFFYIFVPLPILVATTLPSIDRVLDLGTPYQSRHNGLLTTHCVRGTIRNQTTGKSTAQSMQQGSFDDVLKHISGGMAAEVKIPFLGSAGGSVDIAHKHAATKNSFTWNLLAIAQSHSSYFDSNTLAVTDIASSRLMASGAVKNPALVYEECGDEYISQIDYGASLVATLKIDFLKESDYTSVAGALKAEFDLLVLTAKGSGNINFANTAVRETSRVELIATQIGGDQAQLTQILPTSVAQCSLANLQRCVDTYAQIVTYANTQFAQQLKGGQQFSVLRYQTEPYERVSMVKHLVAGAVNPFVDPVVVVKQEELDAERHHLVRTVKRASDLLQGWSHMLSKNGLLEKIKEVKKRASLRRDQITDQLRKCLAAPSDCFSSIQSYPNMIAPSEIDEKILDLTGAISTPHEQLCEAIEKNSNTLIRESISKSGADDRDMLFNGSLPLHLATASGKTNAIRALFQHGHSKETVDVPDAEGMTPLCLAIKHGSTSSVKRLLDVEINIEKSCPAEDGDLTPLQLAGYFGRADIIKALLEKKASKNSKSVGHGRTALHWALISGHLDAARNLLKADIDWSIRDDDDRTAFELGANNGHSRLLLHLGVTFRRLDWIRALTQLMPRIDFDSLNEDGDTALHEAARQNYEDVAGVLVREGRARLDVLNRKDQSTPAQLAATKGHGDLAEMLARYNEMDDL